MSSALSELKRFIFWDYKRASWQYDVMVGLILAFIFLVPREWFRDQPKAASIVMLPAGHDAHAYWIEPELLSSASDAGRTAAAQSLLESRTHKQLHVVRIETIIDSEEETKGYIAYTRP
jgi:hypothetical protein